MLEMLFHVTKFLITFCSCFSSWQRYPNSITLKRLMTKCIPEPRFSLGKIRNAICPLVDSPAPTGNAYCNTPGHAPAPAHKMSACVSARCSPLSALHRPPSGFHSRWTPGVFYTHFYNHARRLRLEKLLCAESFLEVPTDFLNHIWIQVAVSLLKPSHGGFRSETAAT